MDEDRATVRIYSYLKFMMDLVDGKIWPFAPLDLDGPKINIKIYMYQYVCLRLCASYEASLLHDTCSYTQCISSEINFSSVQTPLSFYMVIPFTCMSLDCTNNVVINIRSSRVKISQ